MNQCANARAASLERCKRMLASPLSLPGFLLVLHSPPPFPFSLSNCCLSLTHTIAAATSPWQICSFPLTLFLGGSVIHPLSCHLICSFQFFVRFILRPPPAPFACTGARWCHHFYFLPPCSRSSPQLSILSPIVFKGSGKRQKKMCPEGRRGEKRSEKGEMKIEGLKREVGARIRERRGRRVTEERLKAHYFPLWWEKMSEGAIIKLEFFNTVKNGALTAKRQCAGRAPTTHGEPPN